MQPQIQARPGLLTQAAPLESVDPEARTVEVVFSTGDLVSHFVQVRGEVRRMPTRVLVEEGAADLDFLRQSGPVLDSHMSFGAAGVVGSVQEAWIENGQARARIRFADVADVEGIWARVAQGHLRNISAGFEVMAQEVREEEGPDGQAMEVMYFTRWRPVELSVVPVPADKGSFIQSRGERFEAAQAAATMDTKEIPMSNEQQGAATTTPEEDQARVDAIRNQAAADERARVQGINRVAQLMQVAPEVVTLAVDSGVAVTDFQTQAIEAFAARGQAATEGVAGQRGDVTHDEHDRFRQGAALGVMARAGVAGGERNEFTGMTLAELARQSLVVSGVRAPADRREMIGRAFVQAGGAHSTSDFANILSNVAQKSALRGWTEQEETFAAWTRAGTLTDFRPAKRVGLGLTDSLALKEEGAEYQHGTVGDRAEEITLATYGRVYQITREAIINDDLALLAGLPTKMGRAARRTIGNLAYAVLTGNPNMADGVALFHASHANLAGTGAVLSVTTLGAARAAMRTQTEKAGGPALNISPRYLIVPAALETLATQLMRSTF
ncbi:MAG: HK97 family phage prohead protease, partial [Rhodobacteraceae bacterium]|nr:HK97 family phage prohead protease [Paracoccaceae bacterium]